MTEVVLFFLLVKGCYVSHPSMCLRALSPSLALERLPGEQWSFQPSASPQPHKQTGLEAGKTGPWGRGWEETILGVQRQAPLLFLEGRREGSPWTWNSSCSGPEELTPL